MAVIVSFLACACSQKPAGPGQDAAPEAGSAPAGIERSVVEIESPMLQAGKEPSTARYETVVLDPVLRGTYPAEITEGFEAQLPEIRRGDLETIRRPLDFVGINYYTCRRIRGRPGRGPLPFTEVSPSGECTATDWEIHPAGLGECARRLVAEYAVKEIYITENGAGFKDTPGEDGIIHDAARISFLERHLEELLKAIREGVPVRGYFVWSLLDGFQWEHGYAVPFGLVAVNREERFRRTPKDSFHYLTRVFDTNAIP